MTRICFPVLYFQLTMCLIILMWLRKWKYVTLLHIHTHGILYLVNLISLFFCHIDSARCCKQRSGLLHESHCCMNELTVVFKKSFWDHLSFFTWCVFLPEAAMRRWDTMVTKRWTLSVTILMEAVPFKPCSVGPKVCKENTPHTLYHEPELFLSLADRNST